MRRGLIPAFAPEQRARTHADEVDERRGESTRADPLSVQLIIVESFVRLKGACSQTVSETVAGPNIFDVIPHNLFRPLASPNQALYGAVLLGLLKIQRERTVLPRSEVLYHIQTILYDCPFQEAMEPDLEQDEEPGELEGEEMPDNLILKRAGFVLRRLVHYKWLEEESQPDLSKTYYLPDYATRILDVLQEISSNEVLSLSGLIIAIRAILRKTVEEQDLYSGVRAAHHQAKQLQRGLSDLQYNMGAHIKRIAEQRQARQVVEQLLIQYRQDIFDPAYHDLLTKGHVSRFRPEILTDVAVLLASEGLFEAANTMYRHREAPSAELAVYRLQEQLREIRELFESLHEVMQTLTKLHTTFVDSALQKIQWELHAGQTISGRVYAILMWLQHRTCAGNGEDADIQMLHALSTLMEPSAPGAVAILDEGSLASLRREATPFEPGPVASPVIFPEQERAAREEIERQIAIAQEASYAHIRQVTQELLRDKAVLPASAIPVEYMQDGDLFFYLWAYGDGSLGYTVKELEHSLLVKRGSIVFPDFLLVKT